MTTLPASSAKSALSIGPMLLFCIVYLAAFAIVFAPEGSLSSRATTDSVTHTR